jgi:PAS domain S-box-containing protein
MELAAYDGTEALNTSPARAPGSTTSGKLGQILVVDDEVELKNALVQLLDGLGYDALGCTSGTAALKALRERNFDVLLSDLMMPEMDGVTLLRSSLEIDQNLICIIMTGQGTIQTAVDAMKVGAFDYVLKPFRLQTLLPVLARALHVRRLRQENLHLRETVAIYELCQTIAFTLDRQTLLSKLADAAMQQSEADELSILLLTDDGRELYVAAVRGENRTRLINERVPLEQGISSWVARERTPLLLKGQVNDARFTAMWPRADIRSAISVPLQVAGKLVGIINVNNVSSPRPFTLGQMKALTILASTAAAAMESASLYERLRQAEQNYRSIFENAGEGIFQSTPGGRFLTVNPAMAYILGYDSPEEVIETVTDITHQLYVDPVRRAEATRLQEECGVIQGFEFEAYRKNGEKIWLSLNRRSVPDADGVELYREGSVEDITERKLVEKALRESEDRYRDIVEHSRDLICTYDFEGRLLSVNQTAADAIGYDREALVGRNIRAALLPEFRERFTDHIAELQREGFARGLMTVQTRTGEKRVWEFANTLRTEGVESPIVRGMARDVTEQARAEMALKASEAELRALFAAMTDVILVLDSEGRYQKIAPTDPVNLYKPSADLLGRRLSEVFPQEDVDFFLGHIRRALDEGRMHRVEYSLQISGTEVWFDGSVSPMSKDSVIWIARDISESRWAEAMRRESEEKYRGIVETANEGIWLIDNESRINFVNQQMAVMLGYAAAEMPGRQVADFIFPADSAIAGQKIEQLRQGTSDRGEFRLRRKDGSAVVTLYNASPTTNQAGEVVGFLSMFIDITERKRAEEELLQSEQRYRLLFEQNPQPMWVFDTETLSFLEVNEAAIHHYGYSREEFQAMTIKDIRPPDEVPKLLDNVASITLAYEEAGTWRHKKKDGTIIDVEITAHDLTFYGRPTQMVLAYDVTERRLLEEQLRQSQKMEAVGQLAGGVAHDFNNLLTVITGYSDLMLRRLDDKSPLRTSLEEIKKAGERAASLTRQLLAFSRKQVLQPKVLQLNAVVADVYKMLRRLIGEDIDPVTLLEPSLGQVKADPGQIEQVILNLAVNARDAMPQGGKLTIETANVYLDNQYARRHTAIQPGQYVMLAVSDTGCGIDPETQVRMFEPFFTTKEPGKGTGLGLSTVYGIVRQSGGHLWVYSEVGKGTTMKIYLPRVDAGAERDEACSVPTELPQGRGTVLLTEDEEQVRQMIRIILEMGGYRVLEAPGGAEALALYEQHEGQIDLIMTDVVMPGMSGRELAQSLETLHPGIRVLYMSGYTDDAIVRHGLLDQEITFLQKPFTPEALMRKVREVLDAPPKD